MKTKLVILLFISTIFYFLIILNLPLLAQQPWQWLDKAAEDNAVSLLLMGDTNIQDREDPGEVYKYVLPTLEAADLRFTNCVQ